MQIDGPHPANFSEREPNRFGTLDGDLADEFQRQVRAFEAHPTRAGADF